MSTIKRVKISELLPDRRNANLHTERGVYMVGKSLEKHGAGRSILIDKDNEIIAGNLTTEQAAAMGLEEVLIVETDGRQLVAVKRTDMDLDDPATGAQEMAYADNRAADVSIDFDPDIVAEDIAAGLDLGDWFNDFELTGFSGGFDVVGMSEDAKGSTNRGKSTSRDPEYIHFRWGDLMFLMPLADYDRVISFVDLWDGEAFEAMSHLINRGLQNA